MHSAARATAVFVAPLSAPSP
eukprot:COSAG06_NODE_54830_length_292_cov_1.347150_1_plen_20_part_10